MPPRDSGSDNNDSEANPQAQRLSRIYTSMIQSIDNQKLSNKLSELLHAMRTNLEDYEFVDTYAKNSQIDKMLRRIGLLSAAKAESTQVYHDIIEIIKNFAATVSRKEGQVAIVLYVFCNSFNDCQSPAICGNTPMCSKCCVCRECDFYNRPRSHSCDEYSFCRRLKAGRYESLSDAELLAIINRGNQAKQDDLKEMYALLSHFGSLRNMLQHSAYNDFNTIRDISSQVAMRLTATMQLYYRIIEEKHSYSVPIKKAIDVVNLYSLQLRDSKQECLIVLMLDRQNRIYYEDTLYIGTINGALIRTREILSLAVRMDAFGIILIHNHPSGTADPSDDDKSITKKIDRQAKVLDLRIHDHIIIAYDSYFSFKEHHLL